MNKITLLACFSLLLTYLGYSQIQDEILEECIIQSVIHSEKNESESTDFLILDHGVEFDFSDNLMVNGIPVKLISKEEISNKGYFLFHTLKINDEKAFIRYQYIKPEHSVQIELTMFYINNKWVIQSSKIN